MKRMVPLMLAATLGSAAAFAQATPPAAPAGSAPATAPARPSAPADAMRPAAPTAEPATTGGVSAAPDVKAPLTGANSFTQGQAKSRIEASGFSAVSELNKDDKGVWRGNASKDGKTMQVAVDYRGNVTSE